MRGPADHCRADEAYPCPVAWTTRARVVVSVVLLAGCAEHVSSPRIERDESDEAVDIVVDHYAGFDDPNGIHFTEEEARCTAERIVRSVGLVRLDELGLAVEAGTPPELSEPALSEEEGDAVFAAIEECIDLEGQFVESAGGNASEAELRCVARRYFATDLPRRALLLSGYDAELHAEIDEALDQAGSQCGVVWTPD